ncbi:MAG TPA: fumarylacetoacetate hydrolase family protein, partial [Caldimonas sp.]
WGGRHHVGTIAPSGREATPLAVADPGRGALGVIEALVRGEPLPSPVGACLRGWVNGELRQDGQTRDMIFDLATLIETCSRGITMYPGDVIATGTPSGVGMGFTPPRWLGAGDVVRIEIDGIGAIENTFQ